MFSSKTASRQQHLLHVAIVALCVLWHVRSSVATSVPLVCMAIATRRRSHANLALNCTAHHSCAKTSFNTPSNDRSGHEQPSQQLRSCLRAHIVEIDLASGGSCRSSAPGSRWATRAAHRGGRAAVMAAHLVTQPCSRAVVTPSDTSTRPGDLAIQEHIHLVTRPRPYLPMRPRAPTHQGCEHGHLTSPGRSGTRWGCGLSSCCAHTERPAAGCCACCQHKVGNVNPRAPPQVRVMTAAGSRSSERPPPCTVPNAIPEAKTNSPAHMTTHVAALCTTHHQRSCHMI